MKKLMTLILAIATLIFSTGASALEPTIAPVSASAQIHLAADAALQTSQIRAHKLESRRVRSGRLEVAVNDREEVLKLSPPGLTDDMKEHERELRIGQGLVLVGVTGQVVSLVWLTAELGNFMASLAYPAGAGRGNEPSLAAPMALGATSLGLMVGGISLISMTNSSAERIELVETQLGVPKANSPKVQMTMRF